MLKTIIRLFKRPPTPAPSPTSFAPPANNPKAETYVIKANALVLQKKIKPAVRLYQQAIALQIDYPEAYHRLGYALSQLNQTEQAIEAYQTAIALNPLGVEAYLGLGMIFQKQENVEGALKLYQHAITYHPQNPLLLYQIGEILVKTPARVAEAVQNFQRVLQINPNMIYAYIQLGIAYNNWGKHEEALIALEQAKKLLPQESIIYINLGHVLFKQNRLKEAREQFEQGLQIDSKNPIAHLNYAILLLKCGEYAQAWKEYEHRFQIPLLSPLAKQYAGYRHLRKNDAVKGKTILLYTEQGFGDCIQFIRYATLLANKGATVIVQCEPELIELFKTVPGVTQVISKKDTALPAFDKCCPLLSLPGLFSTTLETIPATIPYFTIDPVREIHWQKKMRRAASSIKIGLVWAGNPLKGYTNAFTDLRRSIALQQYALFKDIDSVTFYSLQKGDARQQIKTSALKIIDYTDEIQNFADTAALISQLDLVISVDTSVVHLAAALGKPTWLLSRFDACWRWLHDRDDSPWYPTMRLFRQKTAGDWASVLTEVKQALLQFIETKS